MTDVGGRSAIRHPPSAIPGLNLTLLDVTETVSYLDTIMSNPRKELESLVRDERLRRGWSQEELSRRSGLSRTGVSAIETERLVPSTAAALALASAFGCRVENLFRLPRPAPGEIGWAWRPRGTNSRFWQAEVSDRIRLYPVESTPLGVVPHDGMAVAAPADPNAYELNFDPSSVDPKNTLVMACCDPAVGLLASALAREASIRLIALPRSSRAALELLGQGLVHVAGVHLSHSGDSGEGNALATKEALGPGYSLFRAATWQEGVAYDSGRQIQSVDEAVRSTLRWVGREPGSGARQCLDELLGDRPRPKRQAHDHRGVAEAIRAGWADVGVCIRLAGEEAGLGFLSVREEAYDLCVAESVRDDPRVVALLNVLRSNAYRRLLAGLPGYDSSETGEVRRVV